MNRCLVCSNRVGKDKNTQKNVRYIATYKMPTYSAKGELWYPKSTESIVNIVIPEETMPMQFKDFENVKPGALVDIKYGVNEYTNKVYVADFKLVAGTDKHKVEDLYLKPASK